MLPHVPGVQMQRKDFFNYKSNLFHEVYCLAIPDDGMDVDRAVDEDKDNDPDKVKQRK